jgi:hypothetical protein
MAKKEEKEAKNEILETHKVPARSIVGQTDHTKERFHVENLFLHQLCKLQRKKKSFSRSQLLFIDFFSLFFILTKFRFFFFFIILAFAYIDFIAFL